jgi:hypothetical protein
MEFEVKDDILGDCIVNVGDFEFSIVDAFLESGYSITLERDLTDAELDRLQADNMDWITFDIYSQGFSRNHN